MFQEKQEDKVNQKKAVVLSYIGVVVMASIIFIAGGRLLYWQALLYLGLAILVYRFIKTLSFE
jgi:hypothetical protein